MTDEYAACGSAFDGPGAPEGLACERPAGHAWLHRKTVGNGSLTWFNAKAPDRQREVAAYLPAVSAHGGRVSIGGHDVSGVIRGVDVSASVDEITTLTLHVKGGAIDVDAEGRGKVTDEARELLIALGWVPPDDPEFES